jgi:uncharacterized protein (DUF697 family)/tellurite resistance protein
MLSEHEKRGILSLSMMAAFCDGAKSDQERDYIRGMVESLEAEPGFSPSKILADVMLKKVTMVQAVELLQSPEARQLAYEVAVQVCDVDGIRSPQETQFLEQLSRQLRLTEKAVEEALKPADEIAAVVSSPNPVAPLSLQNPPAVAAPVLNPPSAPARTADQATTIRNYAILCGALELLPQSIAGMAVIPLQMKMVYEIAQAHGYQPDSSHIKEFMATLGVGLTSQFLEGFARKFLGGIFKQVGGKTGKKVGKSGASIMMSFGTTYAMGMVADQYYRGGRKLSSETLRTTYANCLSQARSIQQDYLPAMQQKAATLDTGTILNLVRGRIAPA